MRFGLFGSAAARRGGGEFDSAEGFRDFIDYNVEAEALGFHGTFVVEHHFTGFGQVSATLNLLTWLGARTRRLRLGTAVIVLPWHNPVLLAEQAATLDLLSGGRLDFGIGKGYRYNEFAGFDVPMEEADARFEESLEVLLKAWTSEERFSHHGKYWQFNDIVVEPPSAQKPHPQVWMGAGSERSIRNVAERGFNLLLGQYASPDDVAQSIAVVQGRGRGERAPLRSDAGRRHPRLLRHRQRAGTRRGAGPAAAEPAAAVEARHDARTARCMAGPTAPPATRRRSTSTARSTAIRTRSRASSKRCSEVGVGYVLINGGGSGGGERGRQSMRRFAREVMPLFSDQASAQAAD